MLRGPRQFNIQLYFKNQSSWLNQLKILFDKNYTNNILSSGSCDCMFYELINNSYEIITIINELNKLKLNKRPRIKLVPFKPATTILLIIINFIII